MQAPAVIVIGELSIRHPANCRVLTVDAGTAERYAEVRDELKRKGRPIPGNDLWIAALTRQHALPLLSQDRHFDFVPGLERLGW